MHANRSKHNLRLWILVVVIALTAAHLHQYLNNPSYQSFFHDPIKGKVVQSWGSIQYIGSAECRECHADQYESYIKTSHYHTSSSPNEGLLKGHFTGQERFLNVTPGYRIEMEKENGRYIQHVKTEEYAPFSQSLDVVFGSGRFGQSYGSWETNLLTRVQAHYLVSADQWTLNPGVKPHVVRQFISNRCLECHATYCEPDPNNIVFNKSFRSILHNTNNVMLKLSCEKCHGPGKEHADHYKNPKPDVDYKESIVNPASLSRDRQIQVCALCHSGIGALKAPSFLYRPGEDLERFIHFDDNELEKAGVHSNNVYLLKQSECFKRSPDMSCSTCHKPHEVERGNLRLFSSRCLECHQEDQCPKERDIGKAITENCIDCHMPKQDDKDLAIIVDETTYAMKLRNHFIKAYPDETENEEASSDKK